MTALRSQHNNKSIMKPTNSTIPLKQEGSSLKRPLVVLDPSKSSKNTTTTIIPTASSLQLLRRQLEGDQIKCVRIGFCESCHTSNDYAKLYRALGQNKSLEVVEIGWELPRPVLLRILDQVAKLPSLESLVLACYTNLPKRLFVRLVSKPTLKHLELRDMAVGPCPWNEGLIVTTTTSTAGSKLVVKNPFHQQHVSVLAKHFSDSIQSLHIVACVMEEEDVHRICEWTAAAAAKRRLLTPLVELSFALSTWISPDKTLKALFQGAICRRLDLTGCRFTDSDFAVIAEYLPQSKTLEELVVARNNKPVQQWGSAGDGDKSEDVSTSCPASHHQQTGFDEFIQVAMRHLKSLDVSCCSLSKYQVHSILQMLAVNTANESKSNNSANSSLESLTMLGIPKGCDDYHVLLQQVLRNNIILKSLRLHPTTTDLYRAPSSSEEDTMIASIEKSLADNYTLEQLQIGHSSVRIDLLLGLNRAGRRHFRQEDRNTAPKVDWSKVLARASDDTNVMYWLLRNGVDHFF